VLAVAARVDPIGAAVVEDRVVAVAVVDAVRGRAAVEQPQ
jgi:hypothetical protein